jgi:hypothetical protein
MNLCFNVKQLQKKLGNYARKHSNPLFVLEHFFIFSFLSEEHTASIFSLYAHIALKPRRPTLIMP